MKPVRVISLALLVALSIVWLIGFARAVLPLMDSGLLSSVTYPAVVLYRGWQNDSETWGRLAFAPFQVADFPTGEAKVLFYFPAWPLSVAAIGCLLCVGVGVGRRSQHDS